MIIFKFTTHLQPPNCPLEHVATSPGQRERERERERGG